MQHQQSKLEKVIKVRTGIARSLYQQEIKALGVVESHRRQELIGLFAIAAIF